MSVIVRAYVHGDMMVCPYTHTYTLTTSHRVTFKLVYCCYQYVVVTYIVM